MTRRICIITGNRADYGHMRPVLRAIAADPELILQILVCGQHLDPRFGDTWREIENDGFTIDARVPLDLKDDSAVATAEAAGKTMLGCAPELARLAPDMVLVLGDRYEILAACVAALMLRIPIAHLHGGEATEAAFDDAIRHSITKMAALHFVAAEPYRQRVIQLGEDPARVILSGAPGLDHIDAVAAMTPATIVADLKIDRTEDLFLVTYHPVTLKDDQGVTAFDALLRALATFPNATMVFTGVNSDPGHSALRERVAAFVAAEPGKRVAVTSLGQARYLSLMKAASVVIGNSSSGLIEAPAMKVPTVNVGDRQKGRLRSASVIDCGEDEAAIRAAIKRALDPAFRHAVADQTPAYGSGNAAAKIVATLKSVSLTQLSTKRFHDIIQSPPQ